MVRQLKGMLINKICLTGFAGSPAASEAIGAAHSVLEAVANRDVCTKHRFRPDLGC